MKKNRFYRPNKTGFNFDLFDYEINVAFKWFDFWVGIFYDRAARTVYFCPLPTFCVRLRRRPPFRVWLDINSDAATAALDKINARAAVARTQCAPIKTGKLQKSITRNFFRRRGENKNKND